MNLLNYYVVHPKQIGHCKSTLYKKKKINYLTEVNYTS